MLNVQPSKLDPKKFGSLLIELFYILNLILLSREQILDIHLKLITTTEKNANSKTGQKR